MDDAAKAAKRKEIEEKVAAMKAEQKKLEVGIRQGKEKPAPRTRQSRSRGERLLGRPRVSISAAFASSSLAEMTAVAAARRVRFPRAVFRLVTRRVRPVADGRNQPPKQRRLFLLGAL